jgi:transcriptional regulator with XRE-family HTH domain
MQRTHVRSYSRYNCEAVQLLGKLIRSARTERKMTGISRGRLQRIEKGETTSEIGAVFEVATIVGVKLFDADEPGLSHLVRQTEDRLALLPKSVRKKMAVVKDDF